MVARGTGRLLAIHAPADVVDEVLCRVPTLVRRAGGHTDPPDRRWEVVQGVDGWTVSVDGVALGTWPAAEEATAALSGDVQLWIAEHARRRVFLHAACVGVGGTAVVLPGASMTGKTTLTAALVRAGATYYSDEYTILDPAGRAHAYPRPLGVRRSGGDDGSRSTLVYPSELGGKIGRTPLVVGIVAVLRYAPRDGLLLRALSGGEIALALLTNAVAARSRPRAVLNAVAAAAAGARGLEGTRGDAEEAVRRVLELVERA